MAEASNHSSDHRSLDIVPPPHQLPLDQSFYTSKGQLDSVCNYRDILGLIEGKLRDNEVAWFKNHPQFKHIFHMPREVNHKHQGLWALVMRTAYIEDEQCWFIVNGIPIRYSIREHALLSGLRCDTLPSNYENSFVEKHNLSLEFAEKYFPDTNKVDIKDVRECLNTMSETNEDRQKMAFLFLICSILFRRKNKTIGRIKPFFLKIVNDLSLCEVFPWGTVSFRYCIECLRDMVKKFKNPRDSWSWTIPCFISPLEILAFECIPNLKKKFRVEVQEAASDCPRMCKMKFLQTGDKGYALQGIYEAIGTDKEIESLLLPTTDEQHLVATVQEPQTFHLILNRWKEVLMVEKRKIFWEDLYQRDQSNRFFPEPEVEPQPDVEPPQNSPLHQAEESPPQNVFPGDQSQEPIITGIGDQSQNNEDPENQEQDPSQSVNSEDLFSDWNEMNNSESRSPAYEGLTNAGGSGDTLIQQEHEKDESNGLFDRQNKDQSQEQNRPDKEAEEHHGLRKSTRQIKKLERCSPSLIQPRKKRTKKRPTRPKDPTRSQNFKNLAEIMNN